MMTCQWYISHGINSKYSFTIFVSVCMFQHTINTCNEWVEVSDNYFNICQLKNIYIFELFSSQGINGQTVVTWFNFAIKKI